MTNTCYECGSEVSAENLAEIRLTLEKFQARKQAQGHHLSGDLQ